MTASERLTGMWANLQKSARSAVQGPALSSCETELQELMKQIDIMVHNRRMDWEREASALQVKADSKDKECQIMRATLEQKHREIGQLRQQIEGMDRAQRDMVAEYEKQLLQVRNELHSLKRSYEKTQRKMSRQAKELGREKEKQSAEAQDSMSELTRLKSKLEEYRQHSQECELQRSNYTRQIDSLEAQRKALAEKCELMQQQSAGYQSQLDKRQKIQDSSEMRMKKQLAQMEGQLDRARDTVNSQDEKIEVLKASLEESVSSHQRALADREEIQEELRKYKNANLRLEDEKSQLQADLASRDHMLQMAREDQDYKTGEVQRLEANLREKEEFIQTMQSVNQLQATEETRYLQKELQNAKDQIRSHKKNEKRLTEEFQLLQKKLHASQTQCVDLTEKLKNKFDAVRSQDTSDIKHVNLEVAKMKDKLQVLETTHSSQLEGMRKELQAVTEELHQRNVAMAALSEKAASMEKQSREEDRAHERRAAELQVTNAQLEALRLENKHLRQTVLKHTNMGVDVAEAEGHLRELQNAYTLSLAKLEQENKALKADLSTLRSEVKVMEEMSQHQLQAQTDEADRTFSEMQQKEERRVHLVQAEYEDKLQALQDKYNTECGQYRTELHTLKSDRDRLRAQLEEQALYLRRLTGENAAMSEFVQGVDTIVQSPPKRLDSSNGSWPPGGSTPRELATSSSSSGRQRDNGHSTDRGSGQRDSLTDRSLRLSTDNGHERPSSRASISAQFLAEEQQRVDDLERIVNSHIQDLRKDTDATIKKYVR
ncbi:centrosomal protein of 63 kDa-like [Lingula anatina]|uniref:Centrosomal protein of 63 kDa-like n=1 Tax=Lingula anatina TaxID=7574 RepID=A0A1S3H4G6_LINAN|nr:centrosomal protein of 63 kDa-like [Lingula anatina]|eukprot:XP_013380898.1 centrosomal protein of 63 kDa-like [Lingula anatina]